VFVISTSKSLEAETRSLRSPAKIIEGRQKSKITNIVLLFQQKSPRPSGADRPVCTPITDLLFQSPRQRLDSSTAIGCCGGGDTCLLCGIRKSILMRLTCDGHGFALWSGSNWPSFITQPVVPILLYFFDWWWVVLAVSVVGYVWSATVVPWFVWRSSNVSARVCASLADIGPIFVKIGFITCPLMAFLIWRQGGSWAVAGWALLWPLAISFIDSLTTRFGLLTGQKAPNMGPVQERFMNVLGYEKTPEESFIHNAKQKR
jgi:hypothetical protein